MLINLLYNNSAKIRDIILVTITISYAIGFVVWAIISNKYNFGPMPVLDAQYLVAGLPIFTVIILAWYLIGILQKLTFEYWPKIFDNFSFKVQLIIDYMFIPSFIITMVLFVYIMTTDSDKINILAPLLFFILAFSNNIIDSPIFYSPKYLKALKEKDFFSKNLKTLEYFENNKNKRGWIKRKLYTTYAYPILLLIVTFNLIINIYENLPQEYGGAKPRIAVFDLNKSKFSDSTLINLSDIGLQNNESSIIRSKELAVFFIGSQNAIIGIKDSSNKTYSVIEISRSAITAISWNPNNNLDDIIIIDKTETTTKIDTVTNRDRN